MICRKSCQLLAGLFYIFQNPFVFLLCFICKKMIIELNYNRLYFIDYYNHNKK